MPCPLPPSRRRSARLSTRTSRPASPQPGDDEPPEGAGAAGDQDGCCHVLPSSFHDRCLLVTSLVCCGVTLYDTCQREDVTDGRRTSGWQHRFEEHRPHLRAVAYRMLGSLTEADDAVQDAWLRVSRAGTDDVENLGGWLTTIVARVCLNMLRSRTRRREEPFGVHLPDPVISPDPELQPEEEALLADSVGLALLVVLDTLTPAERLAFVLHDMFELPFEEIAPMVGRSPAAARQLASRAGRRVKGPRSRLRTPISPVNERSSTPSSERRVGATSTPSSRCSIPMSCCGPTSAAGARRPTVIRGAAAVARQARARPGRRWSDPRW